MVLHQPLHCGVPAAESSLVLHRAERGMAKRASCFTPDSDYQMNPSAVSLSAMPFPIVCLPTSLPQPGLREAGKMNFTSQV